MDAISKHMPRLVARPWSVDFADGLHELYSDATITRMLHFEPNETVEQTRAYVAKRVETYKTLPAGMGAWATFVRETDELIGTVMLKPLADGKIEVGWHLKQSAWGKGYASEAGRAAIRYGFESLGLDEIYAITLPENQASQKVCVRCGMTHLGRTTDYHDLDLEFFRIRADELESD